MSRSVLVLGGGLAGIAAATALAEKNVAVTLVEKRSFLGGRAAAFPSDGGWLDNCQHVLLGSCTQLLDLLKKLNTRKLVTFHPSIPFLSGGQETQLAPVPLPFPFHFIPSFLRSPLFSIRDKSAILRLFAKLLFSKERDERLDQMTMLEWLKANHQSDQSIQNFWNLILVSSLNETLERASAKYGVMVLKTSFLTNRDASAVGTPNVSLADLYHHAAHELFAKWKVKVVQASAVNLNFETKTPHVTLDDGSALTADEVISALPFYNLIPILPEPIRKSSFFDRFQNLETSPTLSIHLWFDREVTHSPFAALPGSPIHWFFRKPKQDDAHYLQLVVSACRPYMTIPSQDLVNIGLQELHRFLPKSREATLLKSRVVRESRATFSVTPGCDAFRPTQSTPVPHLYLAGDWTATGWPATMEGAVRSGYKCAELIQQTHSR